MKGLWVQVVGVALTMSALWSSWAAAAATPTPRPSLAVSTHYLLESPGPKGSLAAQTEADLLSELNASDERAWKPFSGTLSLGYGEQAFWVRVTLPVEPSGEPLVLRMRPAVLDDVRVYQVLPDGSLKRALLGDRQLGDPDARYDTAIALNLVARQQVEASQSSPRTIYIRAQSTSARMARVMVSTLTQAEQRRDLEHTGFGIYFGVMLCLTLWGLAHALGDRDKVFAWFTVYQMVAVAMNFGLMGYARLILPPAWAPDLWTSYFVLALGLLGPVFHREFLQSVMKPDPLPRSLAWSLSLTMLIPLLNLFQAMAGRMGPALHLNAMVVALASLLMALLVIWEAWRRPESPLRRLLVGYSIQCIVILVSLLPLLGLLAGGEWMLYSTAIHGLMLALVLAGLLVMRRAQRMRAAHADRMALQEEQSRTRQAVIERDEKDRFLSMLTHELRTPLSVIRMVLDGARKREQAAGSARQIDLARASVADIDQLIDRTVLADRLDRKILEARTEPCDIGEILRLCARNLPADKATRLHMDLPAEAVVVDSDARLLRVILANLLDNALKYSPACSRVEVRMHPGVPGGSSSSPLRVEVCNEVGRAGRPDPHRVFRKYYRSEGAQHSSGSGQGLYLVQGIARQLGIEVHCRPGGGVRSDSPVCFELVWPEGYGATVHLDR